MLAYALVRSDCHISKEASSDLGLHLDFMANNITVCCCDHAVNLIDRKIKGMYCPTRQPVGLILVERVTSNAIAAEVSKKSASDNFNVVTRLTLCNWSCSRKRRERFVVLVQFAFLSEQNLRRIKLNIKCSRMQRGG